MDLIDTDLRLYTSMTFEKRSSSSKTKFYPKSTSSVSLSSGSSYSSGNYYKFLSSYEFENTEGLVPWEPMRLLWSLFVHVLFLGPRPVYCSLCCLSWLNMRRSWWGFTVAVYFLTKPLYLAILNLSVSSLNSESSRRRGESFVWLWNLGKLVACTLNYYYIYLSCSAAFVSSFI